MILKIFTAVKFFTKSRMPNLYSSSVRCLSIFLCLLKFKQLLRGDQAHWLLQIQAGEKTLNKIWAPRYGRKTPLILPLQNVQKLKFPDIEGCDDSSIHQYNPSITAVKNGLKICWRISDTFFHPSTNSNGHSIIPAQFGSRHQIGIGFLSDKDLYSSGNII